MGDGYQQIVWLALSLIFAAIVITFAMNTYKIGVASANIQQREMDRIAIMQEYRKYNSYDNTEVYTQDIISLLLSTQGNPIIRVWNTEEGRYTLNSDNLTYKDNGEDRRPSPDSDNLDCDPLKGAEWSDGGVTVEPIEKEWSVLIWDEGTGLSVGGRCPMTYTASWISKVLPVNGAYISNIVKDANGAIIGFEFDRIKPKPVPDEF